MNQKANAERWLRISRLFDRALDLDEAARRELLDLECGNDSELRNEIQSMLDSDAAASEFDTGAAAIASQNDANVLDDPDEAGAILGPWRLQRLLGHGGMGSVHVAQRERDDTGQRTAIKLLHRRWDGSAQAQRFLQERRILAALSHPNVPRLIDHGLDGSGRPWFALEYVEGVNLVEWADAHQLTLRARIRLFLKVCAAVQHAHERFVVHRDLKPANILVDAEGYPKVLDFGVAKYIDAAPSATRAGGFAGFTPEYAAPEQISGGSITAATDVYALGAILYQLLTGQLPYRFQPDDLHDVSEAIVARTAERMSKAMTMGTSAEIANRLGARKVSVSAFKRFVRGDLTRIVQTALAKEPQRRYSSVQAFADDLGKFLEGRTVSVSGDTLFYRTRKFVGRNRWSVAMAALAVVALVAGTTFSLMHAHAERIQRDRSEAVLAFMNNLFAAGSNGEKHASQLTAMQMLGRAGTRMDSAFVHDPIGKGQLLNAISDAYSQMGMPDETIRYAGEARAVVSPYRRQQTRIYLDAVAYQLDGLVMASRYRDTIDLANKESAFVNAYGEPIPDVTHLLKQRGWSRGQLGDIEGAKSDLLAAIKLYAKARTPPSEAQADTYGSLATLLSDAGNPKQALAMFQKAADIRHAAPDVPRVDLLIGMQNIAREQFRLGHYTAAAALLEEEMPRIDALAGPDFPQALLARNLLAQTYAAQGKYERALVLVDHNLQLQQARHEKEPVQDAISTLVKAKFLTYAGHAQRALPLARSSVTLLLQTYRQPNTLRGRAQWILGETFLQLHQCGSAEPWLRKALSDERTVTGDRPSVPAGEALDSLGRCHWQQGDDMGAERLLAQAAQEFEKAVGRRDVRLLRTRVHLLWIRQRLHPSPASLAALRTACDALDGAVEPGNVVLKKQVALLLQSAEQPDGDDWRNQTGINSFS